MAEVVKIEVLAAVTLVTAEGAVEPGGLALVGADEAPGLIARGFAKPAPEAAPVAGPTEEELKAEADRLAAEQAAADEAAKAAEPAAAEPEPEAAPKAKAPKAAAKKSDG